MKIRMVVTIEIDPADWTAQFDVEGAAAIRQDVKDYVEYNVLPGVFSHGDIPAEITVK
jgi:glutaredoxin-related protein